MELKTIQLPDYAIRYLAEMCRRERDRLSYSEYVNQAPPSLQDIVAYDSLNAIESALP